MTVFIKSGLVALAAAAALPLLCAGAEAQTCGAKNPPLVASQLPPPDAVLACVGDTGIITQRDVTIATEDLGPNLPSTLKGEALRAYVLDYLIDGKLVAQKGLRDKVDQAPGFAQKLDRARQTLLVSEWLSIKAKQAMPDALVAELRRTGNVEIKSVMQGAQARP